MSQLNQPSPTPKANPVELTAAAVNHLVRELTSGTAYCIAIVFVVMMTGRLVSTKGQKNRLLVVDAGIATQQQFAAATEQNALLGRLRTNMEVT